MMMVSRLSLALWLVASTQSVASDVGAASCGDEDKCPSDEVSLLQLALDVNTERSQADSPNSRSNFAAGAVPILTVNLDDPPSSRWNAVIEYYNKTGILKAVLQNKTQSHMSDAYKKLWLDAIKKQVDDEFLEEARGMLKHAGSLDPSLKTLCDQSSYSVDDMLLSQFGYEMNYPEFSSGQGILEAMQNGTVIHGRNLDVPSSIFFTWGKNGWHIGMSAVTVDVTFMRGGQPLYSSVTWPLQLGIHTAMRFGGWTYEQNTRRTGNDMKENLAAIQQGALGQGLFARRLMEQVPDFETAVQKLWAASMAAPQYFIMSGAKPYEGAVLSIDRLGKHLSGTPPLMRLSPESTWHLVQTNDDSNKPSIDARRSQGESVLSSILRSEVNAPQLIVNLKEEPLSNSNTTFTWVGVPATGISMTVVAMGKELPPLSLSPALTRWLPDMSL